MSRYGFIRSKEEIKYLILYVMSFFKEAVSATDLTDAVMIEEAFGQFEYMEALDELVKSEHVEKTETELSEQYKLTFKGQASAKVFESSLPVIVRDEAKKSALRVLNHIYRNSSITAESYIREDGAHAVKLSMLDGSEAFFSIDMIVLDKRQGNILAENFKNNAEKIYDKILCSLLMEYNNEEKEN